VKVTREQKALIDRAMVDLMAACVEEAAGQFVTTGFSDMGPVEQRIMLSAAMLAMSNIIKAHPDEFLQWLQDHKIKLDVQ
jgi:hypothetical protein